MSMHRPSGCPSCAEPFEEGDRFCGVCGYAVSGPAPSDPRPTLPITPAPDPPATGTPAAGGGAGGAPGSGPGPSGGGYGSPAPGMAHGVGEAAPGWGSVAAAAPTLVDDPGGWAATAPAEAEPRPGEAPYGTVPPGRADEPAARYDLRAGAGTPSEGTRWGPGEAPFGAAEAPYGAVPQGPAGGATPPEGPAWGAAAPPEGGAGSAPGAPQEPPHDAPYEAPQEPSYAPAQEAPHADAPQGPAEGAKTCVACRSGRVDTDGYCEHCGHAQPRERDHLEEELGSVAAVSDRGLRHHRNEDSFAVAATALPDGSAATVAIVCDGVSSASRPDEASAAAAGAANEALLEALPRGAHPQEAMHEAILAAATAVNALAPPSPGAQNAPACTLVGAVVSGGLLTIGWVGDSRAYWVPDDRAALPRRLTEDDSWAAQMVAAGLMGEAEAYADARAHAITGWLGADAYDLEPHTATFKPDHAGVVVVCTDGLWNYAESAREMARVLPVDAAARPLHSAQVLVGHALDGGGHDNVTVAIVPFAAPPGPGPGREPAARAEPPAEPEPEHRSEPAAAAEVRPQV
ncbi:protein phosphatase 2C domain-containing protein [Streptomyces sp. NPDC002990]